MKKIKKSGSILHGERIELQKKSCQYYLCQPALPNRLSKLSRTKLWMSDPEKFNDPLDVRLTVRDLSYRGPFDDEGRFRQAMRVLVDSNPNVALHWFYSDRLIERLNLWIDGVLPTCELENEIQHRFFDFGVMCLTPLWNNSLMWSHYADGHTGFCVEYCVQKMKLASSNRGEFSAFDVQYTSKLPELCLSEALFSPHQTLGRMLATKSIEWTYEQEWRLVHLKHKASLVGIPDGMEISALIAGLKAKASFLEKLRRKASALSIPAYKMIQRHGYELQLELLE